MPPTDLNADQCLALPGEARFAWAIFDAAWYQRTYPAACTGIDSADPAALMQLYLATGQKLGHAPNRYFDERWYRRTYPGVAAAIGNGVASGFDHYCRGGLRTHSPHWLFDEALYRQQHADLQDDVLEAAEMANGYDHYLRHGARELRIGHPFFNPEFYLTQLEPDLASEAAANPYQHYLQLIESRAPEPPTTIYFDPRWYLGRYPDVARAVAQDGWHGALHHYLTNENPTAYDPLPEFSESYYLARYPDIGAAVERGELRNGYRHFLLLGATERRAPSTHLDLRYYARHEQVRRALREHATPDPFTHYLAIGRAQNLPPLPPPEERISEGQAKTLFRRNAASLLPSFARHPLDFTCAGKPVLSVIMVVHNGFAVTLSTLGSLRNNYPGAIELVLIDAGSSDETQFIARYVRGATVMRFDIGLDHVHGCNVGLMFASADTVLLLHSDVALAPGSIAAALDRLASDSTIGAVGGKVIRAHGLLQEAGNIVWRDGSVTSYLRDASSLAPEANFVRQADFCSSACLMLRRATLEQLEGFDEAFAPNPYQDADLCLRIAAAGLRVMYDPSVAVQHFDADEEGTAAEAEAALAGNREIFRRKHEDALKRRPMPDGRPPVTARVAGPRRTRILFIEDQVPLRGIGSGFVRSNDTVREMAALGYEVTLFPLLPCEFDPGAVFADLPDTVEVMYDSTLDSLSNFLGQRQDYYDTVWIARTHNLARVRRKLERAAADPARLPRIILDTEAIAATRAALQAKLSAPEAYFDLDAALRGEFAEAGLCSQVVAINQPEADILRGLGLPKVAVLGHMRAPDPTPRPFSDRNGMLLVGAFHQADSPNYDSLCWFVDSVLPRIEAVLGWQTRLTVAGYIAEHVSLDRFRDHPRVTLLGPVADVRPLYDRHRVFVAPTRYAAGMPYKLHEAASFGLPVVTTTLLRDQTGWQDGVELLAADSSAPERFAEAVLQIYRDGLLWQRLRDAALRRLERDNNRHDYAAAIRAVIEEQQPLFLEREAGPVLPEP